MSHDLSIVNGFAEMAFRGKTPWHGLGQQVAEGATIDQWRKDAGWMWTALSAGVQYETPQGMIQAEGQNALYRSDTGALLGLVGSQYKPVQPAEVVEFFRDMVESSHYQIETMGTLNGGRKLWALAGRKGLDADITGNGDIVKGGLLLATSLDGSSPTIVQPTTTRVVCANTLRMAQSVKQSQIRISHRSVFDPVEVQKKLSAMDTCFYEFIKQSQELTRKNITMTEAESILKGLFEKPVKGLNLADAEAEGKTEFARLLGVANNNKTPSGRDKKESRAVCRILELFQGQGMGANEQGVSNTAWGLLNAVTEFIDHEQGRTANNRIDNAWFKAGAQTKDDAFNALMAR